MKHLFPSEVRHWFAAILMVMLTVALGYFTKQHEFFKIIGFYTPLFLLYLFACHQSPITNHQSPITSHQSPIPFYLTLAILLRLLLVFSLPNLSNDVYRFIWDGRLLVQGFNPFDHLPMYYLENDAQVEGINRELFEAFDSKNTYTVYPPVAQAQFASACWLFPQNIFGAAVVMKLWLFAFEAGSIFLMVKLLKHFQLPARNVLLYALNPLIILEITGNLHFEGAMIFFLLLALWLLVRKTNHQFTPSGSPITSHPSPITNHLLSATAFALSICSKLLTIIFLPFLIKRLGWGRSLRYFAITGAVTALLFLPIVNATFIGNFGNSLNLYFQKLEYNASLYYIFRWLGYQVWGYNNIALIGPALGALAMAGILLLAFRNGNNSSSNRGAMVQGWLFAICLYLACTTTMHPWYVALPVALCIFSPFRFPIVWSGMIFLTYINYSYVPYRENLWMVALEYVVVAGWFLWERKGMEIKQQPD